MKHELKRIITSLYEKIESIQYNAFLELAGAIRGTSKDRIYEELGLESLQIRFFSFIRSTKISLLLTYIIQFPQLTRIMPLEIRIKFLILKPNTIFSKILSFHRF